MTRKKSSRTVGSDKLAPKLLLQMYDLMVQSRVLEERLIKIYKAGDAYFWIGGPGEEAFGVPLGLQIKKGQGLNHDWLHFHYRATPTLIAMGMPMEDSIRLIMNRSTDKCTGGRNFSNHYCFPEWNVVPVSSPIEVQYMMAAGTAISQSRRKTDAVTVVTGGDAGSAEGDFASCLIWSSRPENPLPIFITVQNNKWGISTHYDGQHGEKSVADRGLAFGMKTMTFNGNDPIESYIKIQEALAYIRKERKPVLAEVMVSRLYGHSSASGANMTSEEEDCIVLFEEVLLDRKLITEKDIKAKRHSYEEKAREITERVRQEPVPQSDSVWDFTYVNNENADWRKF